MTAAPPHLPTLPATSVADGPTVLEREVINLFVAAARLLGLPPSLGEIYGLLFMAATPLTLDNLVTRLGISKGSASQGLRALRTFGAVHVSHHPGDRRDHFTAETELKNLVSGFITGQLLPHLNASQTRLSQLQSLQTAAANPLNPIQRTRLEKLAHWHHQARSLAPLAGKFLD